MTMMKPTTRQISWIAMSVALNIIGSQIALLFRLPIYLDSIGTILIASIYGPGLGALPSLFSGLILGMTIDPFSFYYAPVGILLGILTGLFCRRQESSSLRTLWSAFLISLPTSIASALITAKLFGGITSSGSTYLVQILAKTPLGLTFSCFLVQWITDLLDKWISLSLVQALRKRLPNL